MTTDENDAILLQAARESGLTAEYADDPKLLTLYMRKLLIRGWAGERTATERNYQRVARRMLGRGPSEKQLETLRLCGFKKRL